MTNMEPDIVFGEDGSVRHNHPQPVDAVVVDKNQNVVSDHAKSRPVSVQLVDERPSSSRSSKRRSHGTRSPRTHEHGLTSTFDIDLSSPVPSSKDSPVPTFKDSRTIGSPAFNARTKHSDPNGYATSEPSTSYKHSDSATNSARKETSILIDEHDTQDNDSGFYGVEHIVGTKAKSKSRRNKGLRTARSASSKSSSIDSPFSSRMSPIGTSSSASRLSGGSPGLAVSMYGEKLKKIYDYAGVILEDREDAKKFLCQRKVEVEEQHMDLMEDLVTNILKMKEPFLSRLEDFHKANMETAAHRLAQCHKSRHEGRVIWQSLQVPEDYDDFENYKQIIADAKERTSALTKTMTDDFPVSYHYCYEFKPTSVLEEIYKIKKFSYVTTNLDTPLLPPFLCLPGQEGDEEGSSQIELEPFSGIEDENMPRCCFTGCAYVTPEDLLLADWNNGVLKMFNKHGVVCDKFEFEQSPWDVVQVCDGRAAVTVPKLRRVFFVECDPHLRVDGSFETDCECFGICKMMNNYVLTCDPWSRYPSVRIYAEFGQLLSIIQYNSVGELLFKCPLHVCVNYFNTVIYISDAAAETVLAFSLMGELKFIYSHRELEYPTGLAIDRNNWLYICGKESANIQRVSSGGVYQETICRARHGLKTPRAICFNPSGINMVITDPCSECPNGFFSRPMS